MGIIKEANDYIHFPIDGVLTKVARIISENRNGFDFMKNSDCECSKCNGRGIIPAFMHYCDGICFDCGGTGLDRNTLKMYVESNISATVK